MEKCLKNHRLKIKMQTKNMKAREGQEDCTPQKSSLEDTRCIPTFHTLLHQ